MKRDDIARAEPGGLTAIEAEVIRRVVEKIDRICVDVAEIKVKVEGLVEQSAAIGNRLKEADEQMEGLKAGMTKLKTVGATLAALWGAVMTGLGLYARLR